jgi:CheY-like chemotaxis protein
MVKKVLVVDDVPTQLKLIASALQEVGLSVMQASDGQEAIARIQEEQPDLVVLDVIMPRMNGFEVVRELRDNEQTKRLPIVICSTKNTEVDKTWGLDMGADAYVTKPFDPQQLASIVQRLLKS